MSCATPDHVDDLAALAAVVHDLAADGDVVIVVDRAPGAIRGAVGRDAGVVVRRVEDGTRPEEVAAGLTAWPDRCVVVALHDRGGGIALATSPASPAVAPAAPTGDVATETLHEWRLDGHAVVTTVGAQLAGLAAGGLIGGGLAVTTCDASSDTFALCTATVPLVGGGAGALVGAPVGAALSVRVHREVPTAGALVGLLVEAAAFTGAGLVLDATTSTDAEVPGVVSGIALVTLGVTAPALGAGIAQGTWGTPRW